MSPDDRVILEAACDVGSSSADGFVKCDRVIRHALPLAGAWSDAMEEAVCGTGYEHPGVAAVYDRIRGLAARGWLDGKGDLLLPAGPRYTECRISPAGLEMLKSAI